MALERVVGRRPPPRRRQNRPRRWSLTVQLSAVMASLACSGQPPLQRRFDSALMADSMGTAASDTATTGHLARDDLLELSGAAMSARQPGVVFTINDSGDEPALRAIDTTGADRGTWLVTGAVNQ